MNVWTGFKKSVVCPFRRFRLLNFGSLLHATRIDNLLMVDYFNPLPMKHCVIFLILLSIMGCKKSPDIDYREQYLGRYAYTATTDYPGPYNTGSITRSGSVTLSLGTNANSIVFSETGGSMEATLDGANFHFDPVISIISGGFNYSAVTTSVGQFVTNGFSLTQTQTVTENNVKSLFSVTQAKGIKP